MNEAGNEQCRLNVLATLAKIDFKPSCVDMGWHWDIEPVYGDAQARLLNPSPGFFPYLRGFLIRCSFQRPDTSTGEVTIGFGRFEFIDANATETAIVKTAWVCVQMTVHHELMEAFCHEGKRLFDPHKSVEELTANPRK